VELPHLLGGVAPAEGTRPVEPRVVEALRQARIADDGGDRRRETVGVAGGILPFDGDSGARGDLEHGRLVRVHDGGSEVERFEDGQAEACRDAREDEDGCAVERDGEVGVGEEPERADPALGESGVGRDGGDVDTREPSGPTTSRGRSPSSGRASAWMRAARPLRGSRVPTLRW